MIYHLVEPYLGQDSNNTISLSVIDAILEFNGKYTSERDPKRLKKAEEVERDNRHMVKADVIIFFVTDSSVEARSRVLELIGIKPIIWLYKQDRGQELAYDVTKNANIHIGSYRTTVELRLVICKLLAAVH